MSDQRVKTRAEIAASDKWAIEKIYPDTKAWRADFEQLKAEAEKLPQFSGKLNKADQLLAFFKLDEKVSRTAGKLAEYANRRADEDTANAEFIALRAEINAYLSELAAKEAYFEPEILSYPERTVEQELKEQPALGLYRFALEQILKKKPHTLDSRSETLLAAASDCLEGPSNAYDFLTDADMTFPEIHNEDGQLVELTESTYHRFITSKDRQVRKEAFQALFNTYGKYQNTFASLLTSSVKNFVFMAKQHHYTSALQCSLAPNNIPTEVYHTALKTINAHLNSLHRYVSLKKKLLKLSDMHMYDLYVPVIDVPERHYEFDEAVQTVKEGLAPLGKEYLDLFSKGIESGWVDRYPNKGKCSGAYSSGCYDVQPYVLLNFNYDLNSVSTLAHEMGHSLHTYYSTKNQPYIYSDYSLFCAETASTTNEALLIHHLIDKETDQNRKLYLINSQLEQIRTTVFRQLLFAEFELFTHEKAEAGVQLTAKELCAFWHDVNVKYYGPEMTVDPENDMEWARIPHFYRDFYVYQYATGYAAANSFSRMILSGGEDAVEKYKGFLKSGSSDYPINVLRKAGVDMATAKPMEDVIHTFDELLDMLERAL